MKTRLLVSAVAVAALSLGSVSSFAQDDAHFDQPTNGQPYLLPGQRYVQRNQAYARRGGEWQGRRDGRDHEWREHQRREHEQREHAWGGYGYQQPGYVYQQPAYVYDQPSYVYEQPGYAYQPPVYYGGQYAYPDNGGDVAFGAIVGGVIGAAIAANH